MELSEQGTLPKDIKVLGSTDVLGSNIFGSYADLAPSRESGSYYITQYGSTVYIGIAMGGPAL